MNCLQGGSVQGVSGKEGVASPGHWSEAGNTVSGHSEERVELLFYLSSAHRDGQCWWGWGTQGVLPLPHHSCSPRAGKFQGTEGREVCPLSTPGLVPPGWVSTG